MLQTTTRTLLTLCSLGALLSGCGSNPAQDDEAAGPPQGQVRGTLTEAPEGDSAVEQHLETLLGTMRTVNGKRVVDFQLRNKSDRELEFAYRVEWLNRRGQAVTSDDSWVLVHLPAGGAVPLEASAPTRDAESWTVRAIETAAEPR
ncbi:MAG: DUF1425 domain-containing protein [Planctomycetes bacterium]|nr:DUF1425 domain-containing protein [Planctomycetota bacterium]MCB9902938.1 DUF1425 domain-containing protein [Planctomycetota bacterium]